MCEPMTITAGVMAVAAMASSAMSAHDQAKAQGKAIDAQNKQKSELVRQMNIENANTDLEVKDKLQQSFVSATDINLQGVHNQGIMRAAIGESMLTGNSMDRIMNDVIGQESHALAQNSLAYQRDYQNLYVNKLQSYENTKAQLAGMAPVNVTSKLSQAVAITSSGVRAGASAYAGGMAGGSTTAGQVMGGIAGGMS